MKTAVIRTYTPAGRQRDALPCELSAIVGELTGSLLVQVRVEGAAHTQLQIPAEVLGRMLADALYQARNSKAEETRQILLSYLGPIPGYTVGE